LTTVTDVTAASPASTARIGNSAAISVVTPGASAGLLRRSAAIRAAVPSWALSSDPT
jgi:hypothetical protein